MLVNSVIIVLREVIEAALMISVLFALSRRQPVVSRWLLPAIGAGLVGAFAYAHFLEPVSDLFGGTGQELLNAMIQFGVFATVAAIVFLVAYHRGRPARAGALSATLMAVAVALSTSREGSEIIIYVSGFLAVGDVFSSVSIGSLAGAGIGFSVGVLFYYVLLAMPERRALWVSLVLLSLAAAGMCSQATQLLIQADWLASTGPVWDTSWLVSEASLPGQLLYALLSYEAAPAAAVAATYGLALVILALAIAIGWATSDERSID